MSKMVGLLCFMDEKIEEGMALSINFIKASARKDYVGDFFSSDGTMHKVDKGQ